PPARASTLRRTAIAHPRPPCTYHFSRSASVAPEQPTCRARFPGMRTRSGTRDAFSAFRCAAGDGTRVDLIDSSADGVTRARPLVQGQARPRYERKCRALQLSDLDGGGHLDLRQRCGAGGEGPKTAYRDYARSRGENERNLRPDFQVAGTAYSGCERNSASD